MIVFPYVRWRGKPCPIVTIELCKKGKSVFTQAYLDTGATYSFFNADFCERLDFKLKDGERVDFVIGDGSHISVYLHRINIKIEDLSFRSVIGFTKKLGTGINILGRTTVMDRFKICFDGKKKKILWHTK